jgi:broad specificity phosphatase PhoE
LTEAVTRILLVRHGMNDAVGHFVAGRLPGIHLNDVGRRQAADLASRLTTEPITAVYSSPLTRTIETAMPIAAARGLTVSIVEGLTEIDYGEWTGLALETLHQDPAWQIYDAHRGWAGVRGGERAAGYLARMIDALDTIRGRHPGETVVAVSHGDPIRAVLATARGVALERLTDIEVEPGTMHEITFPAAPYAVPNRS